MKVITTLYFYTVGYRGWETNEQTILCHIDHIGPRKFRALCESLVPEAITMAGNPDYFVDVYDHLISLLCLRHGFARVEYSSSYVEDGFRDVAKTGDPR